MDQRQPPKKTKSNPFSSKEAEAAQPSPEHEPQPSLRGRALRMLARREFSRQELQKRLRGFTEAGKEDELETLLDDLAGRGWLSDERYADALVRKRTGQYARRSIVRELRQAGVTDEVTTAALGEIDPDVEFAAALALVRRKFKRTPVDQKEKARQIRFLQSRGYGFGLALRVVKESAKPDEAGVA